MSASPFRAQFAFEPGLVYLNHGSFGACPRAVLDAQTELRAELERNPMRFLAREYVGRLDAARAALASFVGAASEDLVFTGNTTEAVNAVLGSLDLGPGDAILTTSTDYVGCRSALLESCARTGATLRIAELPFPVPSEDSVVDAILAAVTDDVRFALIDHVASPTGVVLPVARIVSALEGRGIAVMVDGAHGVGMLPLALGTLGASYYASNLHKWLCAPKGAAFLHVRADRQAHLRPTTVSTGAHFPRPSRSPFHERFDWPGTRDPTAWLSVPACLAFLDGVLPGGVDEVRARNHALALAARGHLLEVLGGEPVCPASMVGSLASVAMTGRFADLARSEDGRGRSLALRLADDHRIEVPLHAVNGIPVIRVSAQLYNAAEEYVYLAETLARLADRSGTRGAVP